MTTIYWAARNVRSRNVVVNNLIGSSRLLLLLLLDAKKTLFAINRASSSRYNISFDERESHKVLDINIVSRNIWRRIFVTSSLPASAAEISRRRRNNFPFLHVPWALIFNKTRRGNGVPLHFLDFPFRVERISRIRYARCLAARSCSPKSNRTRHACTTNEKPGVRNKSINRILLWMRNTTRTPSYYNISLWNLRNLITLPSWITCAITLSRVNLMIN